MYVDALSIRISTHTPHARRDLATLDKNGDILTFLLTRLMRGVTRGVYTTKSDLRFLLTRLMRGVTLKE